MMKSERAFPKYTVTAKGTRWVEGGHPWIYEGEILSGEEAENGSIVDAVSEKGKYLGSGFLSKNSKIRIRLVSRNANDRFDAPFWERRVRYAWEYRKTAMAEGDLSCCRVIFGEADGFPGLTVDRFSGILVTQTLSVGMEKIKPVLFPALLKVLREDGQIIDGIYERNDVAIRALEGLPESKGWYEAEGEAHPLETVTEICENRIRYAVDFENGQKTGFFLDQKYNRLAVAGMSRGKKVLDCFTHTGSFALNAAMGGASHVTAADISAQALAMAKENAVRNSLENRIDFICTDVFDYLRDLEEKGGHPYDFIILDPPAFTKSRKTADNAEKGYREINLRALRLLPRGGWLATCSCSHFMPSERFVRMMMSAAQEAGVQLMQVEARQQAPDHPILWNVPETDYLKFYLFRVV